ncbi:hypothetical protein GCM10027035_06840 [Emticicia sediminis]
MIDKDTQKGFIQQVIELLAIIVPILIIGSTIKLSLFYQQYKINILDFIEIDEIILKGFSPLISPFSYEGFLILIGLIGIISILTKKKILENKNWILWIKIGFVFLILLDTLLFDRIFRTIHSYSNAKLKIDNQVIEINASNQLIGQTKNYLFTYNTKDSTVTFYKIPENFSGQIKNVYFLKRGTPVPYKMPP